MGLFSLVHIFFFFSFSWPLWENDSTFYDMYKVKYDHMVGTKLGNFGHVRLGFVRLFLNGDRLRVSIFLELGYPTISNLGIL